MESAIAAEFAEHIENEDDSTQELIQRVMAHDDDALNEFVELHKRFVTSVIWSWVE